MIAIVGSSGSGKSTIGSLLLRYYDTDKGTIYIDDENLKDINLHWWRENVGVVSQGKKKKKRLEHARVFVVIKKN